MFLIGASLRHIINTYGGIDVFRDYLNPYSIGYYLFMLYIAPLVNIICDLWDNNISMASINPPVGGEGSPTGGLASGTPSSNGGGLNQETLAQERSKLEQKVIDEIFTETIRTEFDKFKVEMEKTGLALKNRHTMFDKGLLSMSDPGVPGVLVNMLQDQTKFLNASLLRRIEWVNVTRPSLPSHIRDELTSIQEKIVELQRENVKNIVKVASIQGEEQQVKEYFDLMNGYRNKVRKEIVKLEKVSLDGFRESVPELYKLKMFKELMNKDVPKTIKYVADHDSYLKSKLSLIINAKK